MSLFGRSEALAVAGRALDDAISGKGGTLLLTGEAGIGKSALAKMLATEAESRGARVAFGRAWEVGGAPAFWPWSQALGELDLDLDELLGNASGEMASAQRLVAFDRVVRAVNKAGAQPVVLILDDLHAADVASVELALAFARAIGRKRALLIVTTRESELVERRAVGDLIGKLAREGASIPLRRLDAGATASWLSSVGFQGDAAEVHRLSEGNPLFIEEAVRLGVHRFAKAAAGGVPVILAEHLARIGAPTRAVLEVAAVIGREASIADVAAIGGWTADAVDAAAREAQVAGILASDASAATGTLAFAHVLLRDSLYDVLSPSRRESLHTAAAERIEAQRGPATLIAQHLLSAGDSVDPGRIARAVALAVETAVARHAADSVSEMIAHARRKLAGKLDDAATLALDLAELDAMMRTAPSDATRARVAECGARAKRNALHAELARAALIYGLDTLVGAVNPTMVSLLEDSLAVTPASDRALRAQLLARLGAALVPPRTDEGMTKAESHALEALALARELGHPPTLLYTQFWIVQALLFTLPLGERLEVMEEVLALAEEHGARLITASVQAQNALALREAGRPVEARHQAEAYYRLMDSLPLPAMRWKAASLRATMAGLDGDFENAQIHLEEVRRASTSSRHAAVAWLLGQLAIGSVNRDAKHLGALEDALAGMFASLEPGGSQSGRGPWMGPLYAMLGRESEARAAHEELKDLTRDLPVILLRTQTVVLLEAADLAESAYAQLAKVEGQGRFFWAPGGGFPFGPVSRILGELALLKGDHERAREHLDTAIAECREMEAVPFLKATEEARARAFGPTSARVPAKPREVSSPTFIALVREGDVWLVTSKTSAPFHLKHSKGVEYLDFLLGSPGREVYVLSLVGTEEGPEDAGAILDEKAKQQYKQRVEDLEDQLAEAEQMGDRGRATRAREELEKLAEQLASAVGLGGRNRKAASNVERARVNVQRRIKDTIRRIAEHDAALGSYLDATVRTGTYCIYRPV